MEEGDIVLCTVERIEPTTVFVKLPDGKEGTLIVSEIAPGRIKNLREYVVPNKKIACKIIRISGNRIDVSLRRASSKERAEVMERYKQEQQVKSAFNQILKEKAKEIEDKILKDFSSLKDFIDKSKENCELVSKYIPEKYQEQMKKVSQKRQKEMEVRKNFKLKCLESDGITRIKGILASENANITYLAAGNYLISIKSENYKEANKRVAEVTEKIEALAKAKKCEFSSEEK